VSLLVLDDLEADLRQRGLAAYFREQHSKNGMPWVIGLIIFGAVCALWWLGLVLLAAVGAVASARIAIEAALVGTFGLIVLVPVGAAWGHFSDRT
jgi:hypothetical protein